MVDGGHESGILGKASETPDVDRLEEGHRVSLGRLVTAGIHTFEDLTDRLAIGPGEVVGQVH
jgi:hypothetical protein